MFDSVITKTDRLLKPEILQAIEAGKGACRLNDWFFSNSPTLDHEGRPKTKLRGNHAPTGIRVQGYDNIVELTTASLPTVLFGDNGRLIRTPQQFAEAQQTLKAILDGVTTSRTPLHEYVRVDPPSLSNLGAPCFVEVLLGVGASPKGRFRQRHRRR